MLRAKGPDGYGGDEADGQKLLRAHQKIVRVIDELIEYEQYDGKACRKEAVEHIGSDEGQK